MDRKLSRLSMIMTSLAVVLSFGGLLLFSVGYLSHSVWGANNVVEEIAEELLKKDCKITVDFRGEKK